MNLKMNRREFLAGTGALTVSVLLPGLKADAATDAHGSRLGLKPDQLSSYISVNQDGSVVGWIGKVDMGQGTEIGWLMMIAEELDLSPDRVSMVQGHTEKTVDQGGASGSTGIWAGGAALRNAAAEARRTLVEMGAVKLGVPASELVVNDGVISPRNAPGTKVAYGDLIGGRQFDVQLEWNKHYGNELKVQGKAKPKSPSEYKIIGKPGQRRRDIAPKVLGTADNMMVDVKLPGMLHGRVLRPPVAGAVPVAVDEASVKNIPGVKIVRQKDFIGLVAPKEWDAVRAARQLKVTWSDVKPPFPDQKDIYNHIRSAKSMKRDEEVKVGDVDAAFVGAAKIVEAAYEWPFHSHASMAPACGVADMREHEATLWTGGQKPHHCREGIALMFNLPEEKVNVFSMVGPGSYGRNDSGDATMDAAVLSKAVGKPVRVQYMRHDGTGWDPKSPASVHTSRAALDKDGKVMAWDYATKGFSRREFFRDEGTPERTLAGQLMGWPLKPVWLMGVPGESYSFAARRKTSDTIGPLLDRASPLRTSHFRDPGGPQIHFGSESFIDELALAANSDAVEFRLRYLSNPRDVAVVKAVAEKAGWQRHVGARKQQRGDVYVGQGISYAVRGATRVAVIVEVEANRKTHRVWVKRVCVAHDCGQVIAPDLLQQTLEAQIVQTISRSVYEEVKFDNKNVTSVDWQGYPILDMKDAPEAIDIVLLDRPEIPPAGAGEATCRPMPAAIANAIFDATGARLRQAPFSPERLKAAWT
ncbi:MAG: molybdopterin binding aldehyde oxidase and xanthine dehydrogenase [Betaproteobacteria bacterium]|nr:molybdopterin binding aldehyde oxidase and xanthine dehydrogenase [Betaproteobacteria bacterium]